MADLTLVSRSAIEDQKAELFNKDVWLFDDLGYKNHEIISSHTKSLNFRKYTIPWLVDSVKKTVWRKRVSVTPQTLSAYVSTMRLLDRYLSSLPHVLPDTKSLKRMHIEGFLQSISDRSKQTQASHVTRINEIFHCWQDWSIISVPATSLIHRGDAPRQFLVRKPRFIETSSNEILKGQLDIKHNPLCRAVAIIQETGMRGTEVLQLKQDCLSQDTHGDWYLSRHNLKINETHTVPISHTLYDTIFCQIEYVKQLTIKNEVVNSKNLLFVHYWRGELCHYNLRTLNRHLSSLCDLGAVTDGVGKKQKITSHMFRHTVGTNLINDGMSQLFVQRFLGHKSAEMTAVYAHIHDRTLRSEIDKANQKLVDIKGNFYEIDDVVQSISDSEPIDIDAQWLKSNISAQTLPNGICSLPVKQHCPHANACLTCPSFRTDETFLAAHKEQLSRCHAIVTVSVEKSYTRQAQLNSEVAKNLTNIIEAIESE